MSPADRILQPFAYITASLLDLRAYVQRINAARKLRGAR